MTRNEQLFERAQRSIPGGVNSPVRAFRSVGGTPRFIERAEGPYFWDADGKRYIDYIGSWGPMILGHAHPDVIRAVQEAVSNVVRHSGGTVLRVSIRYGLMTHVIVEDNGKGFAPDAIAPTSNGLAMMRTRLKRVGGHLDVETAPGAGTRLNIQLDLRRR